MRFLLPILTLGALAINVQCDPTPPSTSVERSAPDAPAPPKEPTSSGTAPLHAITPDEKKKLDSLVKFIENFFSLNFLAELENLQKVVHELSPYSHITPSPPLPSVLEGKSISELWDLADEYNIKYQILEHEYESIDPASPIPMKKVLHNHLATIHSDIEAISKKVEEVRKESQEELELYKKTEEKYKKDLEQPSITPEEKKEHEYNLHIISLMREAIEKDLKSEPSPFVRSILDKPLAPVPPSAELPAALRNLQEALTLRGGDYFHGQLLPKSVYEARKEREKKILSGNESLLEVLPARKEVVEKEKQVLMQSVQMPEDKAQHVAEILEQLQRLKQASDAIHWNLVHWDKTKTLSQIDDETKRANLLAVRVGEIGDKGKDLLDKQMPQYLPEDNMTQQQMELIAKSYEHIGEVCNEFDDHPINKKVEDKDLKKKIHQIGKDFTAQAKTLRKKIPKLRSVPGSVYEDSVILKTPHQLSEELKVLQKEHDALAKDVNKNNVEGVDAAAYKARLDALKSEIDTLKARVDHHENLKDRELSVDFADERDLHHKQSYGNYAAMPTMYSTSYAMYQQPQAPVILSTPLRPVVYQQVTPVYAAPRYAAPLSQAMPVQQQYLYQAAPVQQPMMQAIPVRQPLYQATGKKLRRRLDVSEDKKEVKIEEKKEKKDKLKQSGENIVFVYGDVDGEFLASEVLRIKKEALLMYYLSDLLGEKEGAEDMAQFKREYGDWLSDFADALTRNYDTLVVEKKNNANFLREDIKKQEADIAKEEEIIKKMRAENSKDIDIAYHQSIIDLLKERIEQDKKELKIAEEREGTEAAAQRTLQAVFDLKAFQQAQQVLATHPANRGDGNTQLTNEQVEQIQTGMKKCKEENVCEVPKQNLNEVFLTLEKKNAELEKLKEKDAEKHKEKIDKLEAEIHALHDLAEKSKARQPDLNSNDSIASLLEKKTKLEKEAQGEKVTELRKKNIALEKEFIDKKVAFLRESYNSEIRRISQLIDDLKRRLSDPSVRIVDRARDALQEKINKLTDRLNDLKKDAAPIL